MGLFRKKQKEESLPTLPDLPEDLKNPTMEAPPMPPPSMEIPTLPEAPKTDMPELPSLEVPQAPAPEAPQAIPEMPKISAPEDDFTFENFDLDSFDEEEKPEITIKDHDVPDIPEEPEPTIEEDVHMPDEGMYVRVDTFQSAVENVADAKETIETSLANGTALLTTNNTEMKVATDKLNTSLTHIKNKIFQVEKNII